MVVFLESLYFVIQNKAAMVSKVRVTFRNLRFRNYSWCLFSSNLHFLSLVPRCVIIDAISN